MSNRTTHRKRSHYGYRTNLYNLSQFYRHFGTREMTKQQGRPVNQTEPVTQTQTRTADRGV